MFSTIYDSYTCDLRFSTLDNLNFIRKWVMMWKWNFLWKKGGKSVNCVNSFRMIKFELPKFVWRRKNRKWFEIGIWKKINLKNVDVLTRFSWNDFCQKISQFFNANFIPIQLIFQQLKLKIAWKVLQLFYCSLKTQRNFSLVLISEIAREIFFAVIRWNFYSHSTLFYQEENFLLNRCEKRWEMKTIWKLMTKFPEMGGEEWKRGVRIKNEEKSFFYC